MTDEQNPKADAVEVGGKTFSPSPDPAGPLPKRRTEDTKSYAGEWTVLIIAVLGWATTFCVDMAAYETFDDVLTPKFLGVHIGQLFSVTVSIIAAKRLK